MRNLGSNDGGAFPFFTASQVKVQSEQAWHFSNAGNCALSLSETGKMASAAYKERNFGKPGRRRQKKKAR